MQPQDDGVPKYLFVGGPNHGGLSPVANHKATVREVSTGTTYVPVKFTRNRAHPITGQPVPMFERVAFVDQSIGSGLDAALQDAIVARWFADGDAVPDAQPGVQAVLSAPTEYEAQCEKGPECFWYRDASKARVALRAGQHNESTGHRIAPIEERHPEPELPATVDGGASA